MRNIHRFPGRWRYVKSAAFSRAREITHQEIGMSLFASEYSRSAELGETIVVEQFKLEGRQMIGAGSRA